MPHIQANRLFRFFGKKTELAELAQFSNHWTRSTLKNNYAYDSINRRFDYAELVKDNPYAKLSTLDQVSQELNDATQLIDKKLHSKLPAPGFISNVLRGTSSVTALPSISLLAGILHDQSNEELLVNTGLMATVGSGIGYFHFKKAVGIKNEWPQKLENLQENQGLLSQAAKDFNKHLPTYLRSQGFSKQKAVHIASIMAETASKNKSFFRFFKR